MITSANIELCYMVNFRQLADVPATCKRLYFGHETCEKLLPAFDELHDLLEMAEKRRLALTFVTPFLTERGMENVLLFLEQWTTAVSRPLEIVTSDWGLLHWCMLNTVEAPVVGRFITGQQLDFRLTSSENRSKEMIDHVSSCTLMKDKTIEFFLKAGVNRFELSNSFIPIVLPCDKKCNYSLHIPFVPLTIFRTCPETMNFNSPKKSCNKHNCNHNRQKWSSHSLNGDIYCVDNALYYSNPDVEPQLKLNDKIDRIVWHDTFS